MKRVLKIILVVAIVFTGIFTWNPVHAEEKAEIERLYGSNRYQTSLTVAAELKDVLGKEQFSSVVLTTGSNFADALSGAYLANTNNAPVILINGNSAADVQTFLRDNLEKRGNVYVLGGENAVPSSWLGNLKDRFSIIRLEGSNRYGTNINILNEVEYEGGEILVCTGNGFADSLSASAVDIPILLVNTALNDEQKKFLKDKKDIKFIIIGGEAAVSNSVAGELVRYGSVERVYGANRYETSAKIAERFFDNPEQVVLAFGNTFPDGLSGGPLAYACNAPLLLVNSTDNGSKFAVKYTADSVGKGYVLGGSGLIDDKTAGKIIVPVEEKAQEIILWHTWTSESERLIADIVEAFNAENKGKYHVTQETQPFDGFDSKTYEAVISGNGPSLVISYPNTVGSYVEKGVLLDFGKYFMDSDYKDRVGAGIYKASTDFGDGGLYAIATTLTGQVMFYNKDLLEKYNLTVPTTWDELYDACKTVVDGEKAAGNNIMGFGPDSYDAMAIIALEQLGLHYIDDAHTAADWTDDKFINWLNWWKKAEEDGYFRLLDAEGYHSGPFGNGNYLCYMGSSAGAAYIFPDGFTVATGSVPQVVDGKVYNEVTSRALIGFTKDNKTDEGAAEFVKYFIQSQNNLQMCKLYNASTPFKDVEETDACQQYYKENIAAGALAELVPNSGLRPAVTGELEAREALKAAITEILYQDADAYQALLKAQQIANAELAK
ncbi:MAG: extracellular solute-binding protein [Erysipelotrichaceae bacterium]|nr:extracellular solute-binding protein [Erysipelotrichaceae bacterium]